MTYQSGNGAKTVGSPDNDTKDTCGTSPIWNSARQKQDEMVMPDNDIEFRRTMTQMSFPCRDTGISVAAAAVTALTVSAGGIYFLAEPPVFPELAHGQNRKPWNHAQNKP